MAGDETTIARVEGRQTSGPAGSATSSRRSSSNSCRDPELPRAAPTTRATRTPRAAQALIDALAEHGIAATGAPGSTSGCRCARRHGSCGRLDAAGWRVLAGERFRLATPPGHPDHDLDAARGGGAGRRGGDRGGRERRPSPKLVLGVAALGPRSGRDLRIRGVCGLDRRTGASSRGMGVADDDGRPAPDAGRSAWDRDARRGPGRSAGTGTLGGDRDARPAGISRVPDLHPGAKLPAQRSAEYFARTRGPNAIWRTIQPRPVPPRQADKRSQIAPARRSV